MNHAAVGGKHRAMAWAIPRALGIIPGNDTAQMCAGSGDRMRLAAQVFPDSKFLLTSLDHAALTGGDRLNAGNNRLTIAAAVEVVWRSTRWIID